MANKKNHKCSQVLMKTPSGYEHMFESIAAAAKFAQANQWTMSLKMQVKGYFEDKNGNKYYRQDEMRTKNIYSTTSAKMTKNIKPKLKRKKPTHARQVIVDGILYESVRKAEQVCGFKYDVLRQALRAGRNISNGHTIAYADEKPDIPNMPIAEKHYEKETKTSIIVNSDDPAIEAINDKIVSILKKAGVYEEIEKLSKAIQKLSK